MERNKLLFDNLRMYYQHASEELRFYKRQIMSLTNYVVLLNGAFIYIYDKYKIGGSVFPVISIILLLMSWIYLYLTNVTMNDMRNRQEIIGKEFGRRFYSIAGEQSVVRCKNNEWFGNFLRCLDRSYFRCLYYSIHPIITVITTYIICITANINDNSWNF